MKIVIEPVIETIEDVSEDVTKTMPEISIENNEAKATLNEKLVGKMKNRGVLASFLLSPVSKINIPDYISQFKLLKDNNSNMVNDLLIKETKPVTVCNNLLGFRVVDKDFVLQINLLKMITNKNYNVDLANFLVKK